MLFLINVVYCTLFDDSYNNLNDDSYNNFNDDSYNNLEYDDFFPNNFFLRGNSSHGNFM